MPRVRVDCETDVELLVFPKIMRIYNKHEAWSKFLGTGKERTN